MRRFYRSLGRVDALCRAHHLVLPPKRLRVEEQHLVFMEENQDVVTWGVPLTSLGSDDPVVWQRNNTPPTAWYSEDQRFCSFLLSMFEWYVEMSMLGSARRGS